MKSFNIPCLDYSLAADWYEGTSDEVILFLIGWSSSKANYCDLVPFIVDQTGSSALVFDYGGHGESPFELRNVTPAQSFLESITVFDWLKSEYPNKNISVVGTSYGGFLAVQLTKYREFEKLVLRVPAIYKPKNFYTPWSIKLDNEKTYDKEMYSYRTNIEELRKHPLLARASKFKGKTLVVVHENDELVPKETTDVFIETFGADSYLALGFGHSFHAKAPKEDKETYKKVIADWLKK